MAAADQHLNPKIIVGLGNPGAQYERTRHNVGSHIVRAMAAGNAAMFRSERQCDAHVATCVIGENKIILATPKTYMNESGRAVQRLLRFFGAIAENLLVVIDDIETSWGSMKLAFEGGTRGHNGIRSIHQHVGKNFTQLRVGVGHPGGQSVADYVLGNFTREEIEELPQAVERAISLIEKWVLEPKT